MRGGCGGLSPHKNVFTDILIFSTVITSFVYTFIGSRFEPSTFRFTVQCFTSQPQTDEKFAPNNTIFYIS
jgi:hypothetical protein